MHSHIAGTPAGALGAALQHTRTRLCHQIDALAAQPDTAFIIGWAKLVAATEAAFRHEETIMELASYRGLAAHRAENARTLGALHHVTAHVDGGDTCTGREALMALAAIVSSHRYGVGIAGAGLHPHSPRR